jgi:hypothetical protein
MENSDALLAILLLKQLLAEYSGCSATLRRSFSGLFFCFSELKEFFSSLCLSTHLLNAHLAEYLLTEHPTYLSPSVHSMHLLNALLAELSKSLMILVLLSELTIEFFSMHHYAYAQCPLGRALTELLRGSVFCALLAPTQCPPGRALQNSQHKFCLRLCFTYTASPPEVFTNLTAFFELVIPVSVPTWHAFV